MSISVTGYDVAIIGLGPTGATLANLLGQLGLETLVLEREATPYSLPRAVHFDDEVMRIFQSVGIAEELSPVIRINPGMRFVDAEGNLLLDWPRPREVSSHGWHSSYRFHQPDLERLLRKALTQNNNVSMVTQAEVIAVTERPNDCSVQYTFDNKPQTAVARYVVGADGANSVVRHSINTEYHDYGFNERWLVIDVRLNNPMPELGDLTIQHCNTDHPATYVRCPGNRRRWEIALNDDEIVTENVTTDAIQARLSRWLSPGDAEIERQAIYTFRSAIATSWRRGRILIAGDAAHLMPPFMGQGMCCGIRDAMNLAWKLAECIKHGHDDELLETYQSERHAHTLAYVQTAITLGNLINTCDSEQSLRSALQLPQGSTTMESITPALGHGLQAGNPRYSGDHFPQPKCRNGQRFDAVCGYNFVLLIDTAFNRQNAPLLKNVSDVVIINTEGEPELTQELKARQAHAIVIRPDRHILGTASTTDELESLMCRFRLDR